MNSVRLSNDQDIIDFAKCFLAARVSSLENDVKRCLFEDKSFESLIGRPAPFPGLLYCFSIIDLLSSLYAGKIEFRPGEQSRATKKYMTEFMLYKDHEVNFIQDVFRHAIVHRSEPAFAFSDGTQRFGWRHNENNMKKALIINRSKPSIFKICGQQIGYDGGITISISKLKDDIKESVDRPKTGYLASVENVKAIRDRFKDAISMLLTT